jgi:hypothetical protein
LEERIRSDKEAQIKEKEAIMSDLSNLIQTNKDFVETSMTTLYNLFASLYSSISMTFFSEVPSSILDIKKPLIDGQHDKRLTIVVSAGSIREHSISVTV